MKFKIGDWVQLKSHAIGQIGVDWNIFDDKKSFKGKYIQLKKRWDDKHFIVDLNTREWFIFTNDIQLATSYIIKEKLGIK